MSKHRVALFTVPADGEFIANVAVAMQPVTTDYRIAGIGDFNGDGRSDVLFKTADGMLETWVGGGNGEILSPMEKLWQDTIAQAGQFVDEIATHLLPPTQSGGEQSSLVGYAAIFGPSYPTANEMDPGGMLGLFEDDREFTLHSIDSSGLSATYDSDHYGSITQYDSAGNAYLISVAGLNLIGQWFAGPPPAPAPSSDPIVLTATQEEIVVTGHRNADGSTTQTGFFLIDPTVNGHNFRDGFGGATHSSTPPTSPLETVLARSTMVTVGHHHIYLPPLADMSPEQLAAANAFVAAVQAIDFSIGTLAAGVTLTVTETWTDSLGQPHPITLTETASDLAAHWATTSFGTFTAVDYSTLNGTGTNATGRGSSNIGPDPNLPANIIAGFNIGTRDTGLLGYYNSNGAVAMEYLGLHEVAHDTLAGLIMNLATPNKNFNDFTPGTSNYANENLTNTIALATLETLGVDLGPYYAANGPTTVAGGWQSAVVWTVNNQ